MKTFERSREIFAIAGIVLATVLSYALSLGNDYVRLDDYLLILENPIVRGFSVPNLKAAFSTFDPELYIPLTLLSYQLEYALVWGNAAFITHLLNLILHTANALLVFFIARSLSRKPGVSMIAGLLFAVHPLHTEAVAWASARKDLLSAFFFLLTIASYLLYVSRGGRRFYLSSIAAHLLGLLSKVSVVVAPAVLILLDWQRGRGVTKKTMMEKLPHLLLSIIFGIIATFGKKGNMELFFEKLLIGAKASIFYLQKLFIPTGFSVLYPYTKPLSLTSPDLLASILIVAAISAVAVVTMRWSKDIVISWATYLLLLAPTFTNFAKGKELLRDVYFASDRYAYLASIAVIIPIAFLFSRLRARCRWPTDLMVAAVVAVLVALTLQQSLVWKDTETLFRNAVARYPDAHIAHINLGYLHYERGEKEEALEEFEQALLIRPSQLGYHNLGLLLSEFGRHEESLIAHLKALAINPDSVDEMVNVGIEALETGRLEQAAMVLERALSLDPSRRLARETLWEVERRRREAP